MNLQAPDQEYFVWNPVPFGTFIAFHPSFGRSGSGTVVWHARRMLAAGVIRRIGAVPNHYRLGWTENGMSVWDVDDSRLPELGPKVGALPFVTHCYRRPRRPPLWPYNLFAMVHGRAPEEVVAKIAEIGHLLGEACRGHDVLTSTRILKKTGLRLRED